MKVAVQYLEGGAHISRISAKKARMHLRSAFEHMPFNMVIVGWDLPEYVVEACADECALHNAELYLWQPLLVGHGPFHPDPSWRVVALNQQPAQGYKDMPEFSFICPNRHEVRESVLYHLGIAIAKGYYHGVFLDRIRFPSPAVSADFASQFGCFCESCCKSAEEYELDLSFVRKQILQLLCTSEGTRTVVRCILSNADEYEHDESLQLQRMLAFRKQSISNVVKLVADTARTQKLKVGLDCFSPTIASMVGQDLTTLMGCSDWVKVMTYARAYGPASLPFEITGLLDWIMASGSRSESEALMFLAQITGLPLPMSRGEVREGRLPSSILTEELRRARRAQVHKLFAGIELVEISGMAQLTTEQICTDIEAFLAGSPDGLILSWDLLHIPLERLDIVTSVCGRLIEH